MSWLQYLQRNLIGMTGESPAQTAPLSPLLWRFPRRYSTVT
jgi:hypothetical protein